MLNPGNGFGGPRSVLDYARILTLIPNAESLAGGLNTRRADESPIETFADDSVSWVAANLRSLVAEHRGLWILVKNRMVIDKSPDLSELLQRAAENGIKRPHVFKMTEPSGARMTAYLTYAG